MMLKHIIFYIFIIAVLDLSAAAEVSKEEATLACRRRKFLRKERSRGIGSSLQLNEEEKKANETIMKLKFEELRKGFQTPLMFTPARNFLEAVEDVEKSPLFTLLKALPKGAVLHGHDVALVSVDFVVSNLTYRDNLFAKIKGYEKVDEKDIKGKLMELHFYKDEAPAITTEDKCNNCQWQKVKDLRTTHGNEKLDAWFKPQLSLNKNDKGLDINSVWNRFMEQFGIITPLVTYEEIWKAYFYQTLKEFHEDNVLYLEFRGLLNDVYQLDGKWLKGVQVAKLYVDELERFKKDHTSFYDAKFIYAPLRFVNTTTFEPYTKMVEELLEKYPDFIAGFDLVGQEDIGTTLEELSSKLLEVKKKLNFFFHAGETNWNGFHADDNLIDALMLGTKRIGHGYAITKHPKVAQYIKEHRVGVELCPISNQVLGLVKDLRNHPAASMFTDDFPIVIAPDDPGFWGAKGVSYDWYEAFIGLSARWQDLRLLKQLALNSIEQTSLGSKEKKELLDKWQAQWDEFIKEVNNENSDLRKAMKKQEEDAAKEANKTQ